MKIVIVLLLLVLASVCLGSENPGYCMQDQVTSLDNAYHYTGDVFWLEWWTFYLYDTNTQVYAMINNIFVKVAGVVGVGVVYPTILTPNGRYSNKDKYLLPSEFEASKENGSNRIGSSYMQQLDDAGNQFHVYGSSKDSKVNWDLNYFRGVEPLCIAKDAHAGIGQNFNWISFIPGAFVNGSVTFDGNTYQVSGYGEHDHPWGRVMEPWLSWTFSVFFSPENNIGMYFVNGGGPLSNLGFIRFTVKGDDGKDTLIFVQHDEYTLTQDPVKGDEYPKNAQIAIKSKDGSITGQVNYSVSTESLSNPSDASENGAIFKVTLCAPVFGGECKNFLVNGWTEFQLKNDPLS